MRRPIEVVLLTFLMVLSVAGCSVPDDPNYISLKRNISTLPPSVIVDAKRWTANRNATKFLKKQNDDYVFVVLCRETDGDLWEEFGSVFPWDMLDCLNRPEAPLYEECLDDRFQELAQMAQNRVPGSECKKKFHRSYGNAEKPIVLPSFKAEDQDDDDVANRLIEADKIPSWLPFLIIGGIVVAVVAPEFLPALCTLSEGGPACPSNPNYPVGKTPQPDQGSP